MTSHAMKVIAVTGATGFVGKVTLRALRRAFPDTQFRLLIRDADNRGLPDEFTDCAIIDGTLDSPDALNSLVQGADCVVHLKAPPPK